MTAAEQRALELYPNRITDNPFLVSPEIFGRRVAFVCGHSEGINHAIATLRGLGYSNAAHDLQFELFGVVTEKPVPLPSPPKQ